MKMIFQQLDSRSPNRNHGLLIGAVAAVIAISAVAGAFNMTGEDGKPDGSATTAAADLGENPPDVKDKIFDDKFSHEDSGWKTATTPIWDASYRDREYELHVLPTTTRTMVDAPVDDVPDSQLIEVKVTSNGAGGEAGVFCHGQSGGFAFLLRADGLARIAKLGSGQPKGLAVGKATELRDDDNRIQAACVEGDGSSVDLAMWVNGKKVVSSLGTPLEDGEAGPSGLLVVRPEDATGSPEAVFDNFSLCSV